MKIQRTLPPTAAPITVRDLIAGLAGFVVPQRKRRKLEAEIRDYFQVKHVFLLSSGKAALTLILHALTALSARRKVLIPAYTCFSVPSAIVKAGLQVSLCDINPESLDFDFHSLEQLLDERPLCVIPTHLLGLPSDVDRMKALCRGKDVFIVEDAAQAMGGEQDGRPLGTLGDVSFFSFGRGKNITCGSGGVILTNSDVVAKALRSRYDQLKDESLLGRMRNFGEVLTMRLLINPVAYWFPAGLPFLELGETKFSTDFEVMRMDGVRAGMLSYWRERLEESKRARYATSMDLRLGLPANARIVGHPGSDSQVYLRLPVMLEAKSLKEKACQLSNAQGLGISPLYPSAIHAIKELQDTLQGKDCPGAEAVVDRLVTLPVHQFMTAKDCERISRFLTELSGIASRTALRSAASHVEKSVSAQA